MLARRGVEHRLQFRINRKQKLNAGLLLLDVQGWPVMRLADVLPPHADHVGAPLRGMEQEREREARLGADRVMRLELRDLVVGPSVESVALDRTLLDVSRSGRVRSHPRLTANWQSERNVTSQLRAACGGLASSSASIHSGGKSANGRSP